jgi:hypothetical protein
LQNIQLKQIDSFLQKAAKTHTCGYRLDLRERRLCWRFGSPDRQILEHDSTRFKVPVDLRNGYLRAGLRFNSTDDRLAYSFIEARRIEKKVESRDSRQQGEHKYAGCDEKRSLI